MFAQKSGRRGQLSRGATFRPSRVEPQPQATNKIGFIDVMASSTRGGGEAIVALWGNGLGGCRAKIEGNANEPCSVFHSGSRAAGYCPRSNRKHSTFLPQRDGLHPCVGRGCGEMSVFERYCDLPNLRRARRKASFSARKTSTMDECRTSFDAIQMIRSARSGWLTPEYASQWEFAFQ